MKVKPRKTPRASSEKMEEAPQYHEEPPEEPLKDGGDICQQLMDRYTGSSAAQHSHLVATAAATRAMLAAESLPLTPSSYFSAAMSTLDSAETLSSTEIGAIMSFLVIVLPVVPPGGIAAPKATEAVEVLVRFVGKDKDEKLGASGLRSVVKCVGILLGLCNLEDWDSLELGFETLLKLCVDKRPKVRRSAQECFEKVFKLFQSPSVIKKASGLVLSFLENYIPLAVNLSSNESETAALAKPENVEVLHMLSAMTSVSPYLSPKVSSKILSHIFELMGSEFSPLTRHILKIIELSLEASRVGEADAERIIVLLSSYISSNGNPTDTLISAASLLRAALDKLQNQGTNSWIKSLPIVLHSIAGLLISESDTASQASTILKELIKNCFDGQSFSIDDQLVEDDCPMSDEARAVKTICAAFESSLDACKGIPNDHVLSAISTLFVRLGKCSYIYMKSILLKLAELMKGGATPGTDHIQRCIGSAVIAIGPETMLTLLPISIHGDLSCTNTWLIPILRDYVVGSSLEFYMDHIVPLAKSFQLATRKAEKSPRSKELQNHAHDLWKLLPAFCRYPTDTKKQFKRLAVLLAVLLKKYGFMHERVALALKVLVNQNKCVLGFKSSGKLNESVMESIVEFQNVDPYSTKTATKNMKALAGCSIELLQYLSDQFVNSKRRPHLKDAISCLASISDSSAPKEILSAFIQSFDLLNNESDSQVLQSDTDASLDDKQENMTSSEKDVKRCRILELASFLVEGANEDLINLIFDLVKHTLKETSEIGHNEAYHTLSRVLEEHAWFCSSHGEELIGLLLGLKTPTDIAILRSRFDCFHMLLYHDLKMNLEEENKKAFLILNEIIVTLKNSNEDVRKVASDVLIAISSSSIEKSLSSDTLHQKLARMIMGYLSGTSPHITSGAISALSVLLYKDYGATLSVTDLVPCVLSLLQSKALEIIKGALGFARVLVSCLPANDLQHLLKEIVDAIIPLSSVSRHHFRLKVTVIVEIIIRKCGFVAVESLAPDKYKAFLRTVSEHKHKKPSKEDGGDALANNPSDGHTDRSNKRKRANEAETTRSTSEQGKRRRPDEADRRRPGWGLRKQESGRGGGSQSGRGGRGYEKAATSNWKNKVSDGSNEGGGKSNNNKRKFEHNSNTSRGRGGSWKKEGGQAGQDFKRKRGGGTVNKNRRRN